ncbi:MAG: histidine--tRNA ligase [Rhodospirillaceae bacterium]|nr:histidine--tRNA ligase [Rhodospirillaceae bacterium]
MSNLQPVRGTHDLMFDDIRRHRLVEDTAFAIAGRYGYGEIATPVFEATEVFTRTLGDTTDIVTKEMYTFETKGGERITLRPEGTAGVARAFISEGLAQQVPLKFFYREAMFRYERPQKGRQRQFHQIGVELIGVPGPQADVEVIALGHHILTALGVAGNIKVELNSLGDGESRAAYRDALIGFLGSHLQTLSPESRDRLERNPLRILDSKDPADRALVANAPRYTDYLNTASRDFFQAVQEGLTRLGVPFVINPGLVRGLDYYSHTAFEFTTDALGAQGTVLAGGRYDGLIPSMGGPAAPGVGWAAGVERLAMLIPEPPPAVRPVAVIPVGDAEAPVAEKLAHDLRKQGFAVDLGYSGNMGKRLKRADKVKARAAVILGADEVRDGVATLRDLDSGEQRKVPFAEIAPALKS